MPVISEPQSAKILLLDLSYLSTEGLQTIVVHCPTVSDLAIQASKYPTCILIIACRSDSLSELIPVLSDLTFDTLYILNVDGKIEYSVEPWSSKATAVYTDNELMRHLCTKSVMCYYIEAMEHKDNKDMSLANRCLMDGLNALEYAKQFI
ncbi:unnamed protein product [Adineta ricciae]|uniref:Uncharacterized protein n=1 Tax=Adineta ricciae TaxID=249248 RepID=A0A814IUF8_ADIRI|nr:unnamed protein product [Adineta ricciae]CAF1195596.1 unnamed protein product [Adineta ricciae]